MTSRRALDKRSLYYQTIARDFFDNRGAPFFLSSKDQSQIEEWEKAGIPLRIVREGIAAAFCFHRKGRGKKRKVQSLSLCAPAVQQAFAMYRERATGRERETTNPEVKKKAVGAAVARFLKDVPPQVNWLDTPYRRVMQELAGCSDEDLERMEEEVDSLLLSGAGQEDVEEAAGAVAREFPSARPEEVRQLLDIVLIKHMREKYRIPHLAPYHY